MEFSFLSCSNTFPVLNLFAYSICRQIHLPRFASKGVEWKYFNPLYEFEWHSRFITRWHYNFEKILMVSRDCLSMNTLPSFHPHSLDRRKDSLSSYDLIKCCRRQLVPPSLYLITPGNMKIQFTRLFYFEYSNS